MKLRTAARTLLAGAVMAAGFSVAGGSPVEAAVNKSKPAFARQVGADCAVVGGFQFNSRDAAAGAAQIKCHYVHARTTANIKLWYFANGRWNLSTSTGPITRTNTNGLGNFEFATRAMCSATPYQFMVSVDYSISGAGSGTVYSPATKPWRPCYI